MASGTGKKILISLLALLIVVGAAVGIWAWYFASKHKTEFGKKGEITKGAATKVEQFAARVRSCKKEVFGHKDLPYKPKKDSGKDGWKKATEALVRGLKTCLQGQRSADGKGYSGKMDPKYLDELLAAKECPAFADNLMKFKKCQFLFEELPDYAGFDDGLGDDDAEPVRPVAGMDAMGAEGMKADAMGAEGMKADAMGAEGMKADAMGAEGMKVDTMGAEGMRPAARNVKTSAMK